MRNTNYPNIMYDIATNSPVIAQDSLNSSYTHLSMTGVGKKPWNGTPGVRKTKIPRLFTYTGELKDDIFLLKTLIKSAAYASTELRRIEHSTRSFRKAVRCRTARITDQRSTARAMNLAYAFIRGKTYRSCENSTKSFRSFNEFSEICMEARDWIEFCGGSSRQDIPVHDVIQWVLDGFDGTPAWSTLRTS